MKLTFRTVISILGSYRADTRGRARALRAQLAERLSGREQPKTAEERFVLYGILEKGLSLEARTTYRNSSEYQEQKARWAQAYLGSRSCCAECGSALPCRVFRAPESKFCSCACWTSNPEAMAERLAKTKARCMERFGTENPGALPRIRKKRERTMLANHGVKHALQSKTIQKKYKATCLERFGAENPSRSKSIQAKKQRTCLTNHGVAYPFSSKQVQRKSELTRIERYGVAHSQQSTAIREKTRRTCLMTYGVASPSQDAKIHQRQVIAGFRRKEFATKEGLVLWLQGFEPQVAEFLQNSGGRVDSAVRRGIRVPYTGSHGKERYYFPDLFVRSPKGISHLVEVKSTYSARAPEVLSKYKAAQKRSEAAGLGDYLLIIWQIKNKPLVFRGRKGFAELTEWLG